VQLFQLCFCLYVNGFKKYYCAIADPKALSLTDYKN
jgi:hypothetical protein